MSPQEKIVLYRSLFRGRNDIYALRWENTKTGRVGYAPACENEWHPKLCRKPKIKCSACPNQKWKPLTDRNLYSHLTGECFIGIYPLLQDDHCNFLAIDFDKERWKDDVLAFVKVCNEYNISHLVERSQSGNGAHIWIFFKESISASIARNLGTALLTLTMQLYPSLSMDSYDRLFPNQDTLPKGGFGNLIALPLQEKRRADGNSIFINVNDNFLPYADPWQLLTKIKKFTLLDIQAILAKIQQVTGILDMDDIENEDENVQPWKRQNETVDNYPVVTEVLPKTLEIVNANLLYVPIQQLPAKVINRIRKIAAFQNPEFYRAQAMRLSTFGKPRIIHCAELFTDHIGLPRGCDEELFKLLKYYHIQPLVIDKRELGKKLMLNFMGIYH